MSEARKRWKFPIPYGLPRSAIDYRRNPEILAPRSPVPLGETYLTTFVGEYAFVWHSYSVPWLDPYGAGTRR